MRGLWAPLIWALLFHGTILSVYAGVFSVILGISFLSGVALVTALQVLFLLTYWMLSGQRLW